MAEDATHGRLRAASRRGTRRAVLGVAAGGAGVAGAVLAACGSPPGAGGEGAVARSVKGPVTVVWSSWATDDAGKFREQERIDLWKQLYPDSNISVDMNNFGEYFAKLEALLVAGTGPDVFRQTWENLFPYQERGQIAELDPYFRKHPRSWLARPDLKRWILDNARYRGKLYGTPMGGAISSIFINRNLFQTAQVKAPPAGYKDPAYEREWTFDQLLESARRLTKPPQYGINMGAGAPTLGYSLVESFGGETLSKDWDAFLWTEDPAIRAWDWLASLRFVHRVAPPAEEEVGNTYLQGTRAMAWWEVSQMTYLPKAVGDAWDWDQAPWPHQPGKPPRLMFLYSAWVLNKESKHPDEAFLWLHHVSGPEGTRPGVDLGWELPIFKELDPLYNQRIADWKKNTRPALEGMDFAIPRLYHHQPRWGKAWSEYISPAVNDIIAGKQGPAQALRAIKAPVDALLKEGAALMR